jgi:hypothetical protein
MVFASAGKERMLKILYGDELTDTIAKFKIGTGSTPFTANDTDLTTPASYGGGELQDFTATTYVSGTTTMTAQADITTTDWTGTAAEFGIFTASGVMVFAETFSPYYKDGSTNLRILANYRML